MGETWPSSDSAQQRKALTHMPLPPSHVHRYAVAPQDDDGPALREITYRQPAPRRPYAEAQQKQPHTDARQPGGGLKAARGVSRPAAEPEQHLNSR